MTNRALIRCWMQNRRNSFWKRSNCWMVPVRNLTRILFNQGKLSPVFFGSALTNFGVETFLEHFLKMTSSPLPRTADIGVIDPMKEEFSAFVFKIQANMNKAPRDRIAFMRICSGKFDASQEVYHVQGNKKMRLSQPQQMMASDRHVVEEAYAGDIIGVFDPGIFSIGDTVCSPGKNSPMKVSQPSRRSILPGFVSWTA